MVKELDCEVTAFHRRPLAKRYRFVYLDGLWVTLSKPVTPHQRCVVHKVLDLANHLMTPGHGTRLRADAFHIFEAATETEASRRLRLFTGRWSASEPKAVRVFLREIDNGLVYLRFAPSLQRTLKATNPIDRYLEEIRRRTIPMPAFNNRASIERIVYVIIAYVLNHQPDMPMTQFTQVT